MKRQRLVVLSWHNVDPTWCYPTKPGAGLRGLTRQLAFCRRFLNVVPLEAAAAALADGGRLPPRAVALTFDDGYRDSLTRAAPVLRRLELPATFFLVPGLLSRTTRPWWEVVAWIFHRASAQSVPFEQRVISLRTGDQRTRAAQSVAELLKQRDAAARAEALDILQQRCRPAGTPPGGDLFLDWEGARRLVASGFAVGSHSYSHHILGHEDAASQYEELARSRRELEGTLQVPVRHLAYPNGKRADYSATTVEAARAAGHIGAWTTRAGENTVATPPYELRRFVLDPERGLAAFPFLPKQWYSTVREQATVRDRGEEATCAYST